VTILANIKTVLEADSTLLALATGGVWDFDETKRLGLNRTTTAAAFDSNDIIKPCVLLKTRSEIPDGILTDDVSQYSSVVATLEAWFYADYDFTNIDAMSSRVYTLLHAIRVTGSFQVFWTGDAFQGRDDELDAMFQRSDYVAQIKRST